MWYIGFRRRNIAVRISFVNTIGQLPSVCHLRNWFFFYLKLRSFCDLIFNIIEISSKCRYNYISLFHLSAVVCLSVKFDCYIERLSAFFYFNNKAISSVFLLHCAKRIFKRRYNFLETVRSKAVPVSVFVFACRLSFALAYHYCTSFIFAHNKRHITIDAYCRLYGRWYLAQFYMR